MGQEIYDDPHDFSDWDLRHSTRCFVHMANSMTRRAITGELTAHGSCCYMTKPLDAYGQ